MTTADWIQRTFPGGPQAIHINRAIRSVAIGEGATASGVNSFAQGFGSLASAVDSHAEGNVAAATNAAAHAEGIGTVSSGIASHAEGSGSQATGGAAHAEGTNTVAINVNAHAEGANSSASGGQSHAEGQSTQAIGVNSHAEGEATIAAQRSSHAAGVQSVASREGQWAFSSGQGGLAAPAQGNSQLDLVTMVGETPGVAPTESVELVLGPTALPLSLDDGKDYTFTVTAAVGAVQPGPARVGRAFILYFNARRDAGVSVIIATGVGQSFGDASTNDWTLVASIGAAPDRIALTFTTGAITSAAKVTAEVRFVEIAY
jgi:hypothetical protein